jgi:hypothetical protein
VTIESKCFSKRYRPEGGLYWRLEPKIRYRLGSHNRGTNIPLTGDERPHTTCQWLEGEPRVRDFCGAPTTRHKDGKRSSYCRGHHRRCWKPMED